MGNIYTFGSSGEAYDACQTNETIKKGSILLILSEGIVGLADTWPIAVTEERGMLHQVSTDWLKLSDEDRHFTDEQVREAQELARSLGFSLDPNMIASDSWNLANMITYAYYVHQLDESGDATLHTFIEERGYWISQTETVDLFFQRYLAWAQGPLWHHTPEAVAFLESRSE